VTRLLSLQPVRLVPLLSLARQVRNSDCTFAQVFVRHMDLIGGLAARAGGGGSCLGGVAGLGARGFACGVFFCLFVFWLGARKLPGEERGGSCVARKLECLCLAEDGVGRGVGGGWLVGL
jgi:hypothetical protein